LEEDEAHPHDMLYTAGEPPEFFYLVREGCVRLVGEGYPPRLVHGPTVPGMLDGFIDEPRKRSAIAVSELTLMKARMDDWMELLEDSFVLVQLRVHGLATSVADLELRSFGRSPQKSDEPPVISARTLPIGLRARLNFVERLACLVDALPRGIGVQPLNDLAIASNEIVFHQGQPLFEQGGGKGRVMVVVDGEVEARRDSPTAIWRGGAGQIVCGTAAFCDAIDAWQARATTNTCVIAFRVADWLDLLEEQFEMVRATLGDLYQRSEQLLDHIARDQAEQTY
jgi:CRP-like cAMP-binding protein